MQIKQFEYIQEIAETKSISKAAQKLFISQQALSEALKLFENELGFKIFVRSNKGVEPTAAGSVILKDLDQIMPVIHSWRQFADSHEKMRDVKILLQNVLNPLLIYGDLLERLNMIHHVNIEWETLTAPNIIERLKKGEQVIALLLLSPGDCECDSIFRLSKEQRFMMEELSAVKMSVVLRADDALTRKGNLQIQDLYGKELVGHKVGAKLEYIKRINDYTGRKGYWLPPIVDSIDFLLQHENTFAYMPELILKRNIHVQERKVAVKQLEQEADDSLHGYLVYNTEYIDKNQKILSVIKSFFSELSSPS